MAGQRQAQTEADVNQDGQWRTDADRKRAEARGTELAHPAQRGSFRARLSVSQIAKL